MKHEDYEALLDAIADAQKAWIIRHYGCEVARTANYGWGDSEEGIATKVYGQGILTTDADLRHTFEPFTDEDALRMGFGKDAQEPLTMRFLGDNITLRRYQWADLYYKLRDDEPDRKRIVQRLAQENAPGAGQ